MSSMANKVNEVFKSSADLIKNLSADDLIKEQVINTSNVIINAIRNNNKVIFFGNGGSAADSQHMAGEFVCRFMFDRKSLPGIALTTDSSVLTAISNDYGYEQVFSRQLQGLSNKGDIAFGFSTSGNSENIVLAFKEAKELGLISIGLSGESGGKLNSLCDYLICIPSKSTPRIQEAHLLVGHAICEIVEESIFR